MKRYTYNIGTNKGNSRIWIEGNTLLKEGFNCGDRFCKLYHTELDHDLMLMFYNDGTSKIAGNASRPIIDLNGKFLNSIFKGFKKYRLKFGYHGNLKAIYIDGVI